MKLQSTKRFGNTGENISYILLMFSLGAPVKGKQTAVFLTFVSVVSGESGKSQSSKSTKKRKKPQHPNSYPSGKSFAHKIASSHVQYCVGQFW